MNSKRSQIIVLVTILSIACLLFAVTTFYQIDPGQCRQCGRCMVVCPAQAVYGDTISGNLQINPALCNGCGLCVEACPYGAVYSVTENSDNHSTNPALSLRCYPNPAQECTYFLHKQFNSGDKARIMITNPKGQTVKIISTNQSTSTRWDFTGMSGRKVPAGLYIATLCKGKERTSVKITKVKL